MSQGLILYSDGSANPNPGPTGYGIHGYLFTHDTPKKGTGHTTHHLSRDGYKRKSESEPVNDIVIQSYIDAYGSIQQPATNNIGEMAGVIQALRIATQWVLDTLIIYTDSQYVCVGMNERIDKWEARNWTKPDGTLLANVERWKELVTLHRELVNRGVKVEYRWIRGHNEDPGNEKADQLADIGRKHSSLNIIRNEVSIVAADGYWKSEVEKNPLIANSCLYFNTLAGSIEPGKYYLGEQGKDSDTTPLGSKVSDGTFSIVMLKQPDPVIELVREFQIELADQGTIDSIIMARLDKLYSARTYRELIDYGTMALDRARAYKLDIQCLDEEPLTKEFKPAKTALEISGEISFLESIYERYLAQDPKIITTDLTPILYETTEKTKKKEIVKETVLKSSYNVGFAALQTDINYEAEDGTTKSIDVILTLGIDLPNRNALKRLESVNPKITLVSWKESDVAFRYATIIQTDIGESITAGVYSNLRVITEKPNG